MQDIDCIIDEFWTNTIDDQSQTDKDELVRILCDAVCKNFITTA